MTKTYVCNNDVSKEISSMSKVVWKSILQARHTNQVTASLILQTYKAENFCIRAHQTARPERETREIPLIYESKGYSYIWDHDMAKMEHFERKKTSKINFRHGTPIS